MGQDPGGLQRGPPQALHDLAGLCSLVAQYPRQRLSTGQELMLNPFGLLWLVYEVFFFCVRGMLSDGSILQATFTNFHMKL